MDDFMAVSTAPCNSASTSVFSSHPQSSVSFKKSAIFPSWMTSSKPSEVTASFLAVSNTFIIQLSEIGLITDSSPAKSFWYISSCFFPEYTGRLLISSRYIWNTLVSGKTSGSAFFSSFLSGSFFASTDASDVSCQSAASCSPPSASSVSSSASSSSCGVSRNSKTMFSCCSFNSISLK